VTKFRIVKTKLFSELGLSSELLKAIDKLGFEQAAPIQAEAIPVLLAGKDVVGQSQTGSGKTVAFAAPAIEKVSVDERATQVLILCPTRELAFQRRSTSWRFSNGAFMRSRSTAANPTTANSSACNEARIL